jgi:fermentation-respiration switch protein FrsA (DUF1100 family)
VTSVQHRDDIEFSSEGERIAGWFYPGSAGTSPSRRPCVVVGHGFAGVKEARLDAFAGRFAEAALACVVFDYRHLGASGGAPRQLVDLNRHRADWDAAIAYARTRADVDADRIGLWGTSLGGGLVLEIVARRTDIGCAVVQAPLVNPLASGAEAPGHTRKMAVATIRDLARAALRRTPYAIPVVGPFGTPAFMTEPEAEPGYRSIVQNAPSWRNEVSARTAVQLALFRPARRASQIACPLLVVTGTDDQITPRGVTLRALAGVPQATHVAYEGGHFDGYLGAAFERSADAAVAFFEVNLSQRGRAEARGAAPAPPAA